MDYYRGCYIKQGDAPTNEQKMRHLNWFGFPWVPPHLPCLWAWFKFDEGEGNSIIDYSPFGENGCWLKSYPFIECLPLPLPSKYWSVPGFGHNEPTDPNNGFKRTALIERAVFYMSFIGFIRPLGFGGTANYAILGNNAGGSNNIIIGWQNDGNGNVQFWIMGKDGIQFSGVNAWSLNEWYCLYAFSSNQDDVNRVRLYVRKNNEPFLLDVDELPLQNNTPAQSVYNFGVNGTRHMDGGDSLYWTDSTTCGIISLEEANNVYDHLKNRYEMN